MNLMDVSLDITPVEEPTNTRLHSLKALARAIQERNKRPNLSTVRELVLENLQNVPILDSVATDPLRDIERLHIKILSEEYGILDLVPNLVELTLAGKNWAAIPGAFYGMDVVFPRLDTLTLQGLENLHKWHFDWVLSHKSLRNLNLHQCTIATHCLVQQPKFVFWRVNLDGWVRVQDDTHDPDHQHRFPIDYTPTPDDDEPGWNGKTTFDMSRIPYPPTPRLDFGIPGLHTVGLSYNRGRGFRKAKHWRSYFKQLKAADAMQDARSEIWLTYASRGGHALQLGLLLRQTAGRRRIQAALLNGHYKAA
ncbi:hypothetical protein ACHAPD_003602 [Fusarium lateritium]